MYLLGLGLVSVVTRTRGGGGVNEGGDACLIVAIEHPWKHGCGSAAVVRACTNNSRMMIFNRVTGTSHICIERCSNSMDYGHSFSTKINVHLVIIVVNIATKACTLCPPRRSPPCVVAKTSQIQQKLPKSLYFRKFWELLRGHNKTRPREGPGLAGGLCTPTTPISRCVNL